MGCSIQATEILAHSEDDDRPSVARELRFWLVEDREFESPERQIEEHNAIMAALESEEPNQAHMVLEDNLTLSLHRAAAIFATRAHDR